MRNILYFLTLVLALSCSNTNKKAQTHSETNPGTNKDPFTTETNLVKKYSLDELGSALNIMRALSDQAKKKPNKEFCDLSFEQASLMAQQLRFLIEEKIEEMGQQKLIPSNPPEDWRRCYEKCNCYVYARAYQDQHTYFNQKMTELNSKQAYECAQNARWFCGSDLHQYLKSLSVLPEADY